MLRGCVDLEVSVFGTAVVRIRYVFRLPAGSYDTEPIPLDR